MKRIYILFLFSLLLILLLAGIWFVAPFDEAAPFFPRSTVLIEGSDGKKIIFDTEIATTPKQHAYGLMFRKSLPQNSGMLFVFDPPQTVKFWMKNTYIPLDIIFARKGGVIVKIVPQANPLDEGYIYSGEPVGFVLEIGGGEAGRLNIREGDRLVYSLSGTK